MKIEIKSAEQIKIERLQAENEELKKQLTEQADALIELADILCGGEE